jgi:hypothetical protein
MLNDIKEVEDAGKILVVEPTACKKKLGDSWRIPQFLLHMEDDGQEGWTLAGRQFFIKLQYLFQI